MLHRNYTCWQNTPAVHIQRALYELEPVVCSSMNIRSLFKEKQRDVPKVELLKFSEAVGDCDTRWTSRRLVACPIPSHRSCWRTSRTVAP